MSGDQRAPASGVRGAAGAAALRFELPGGGRVIFSDRSHGNASSVGGDGAERGALVREQLRQLAGVEALARGYQVHGARVARVRASARADAQLRPADADGQATALRGVGTMVLAADCLPVALGCEGAVAMVHAGWRGIAAGVLREGVAALRELGGAGEIRAVIGPGAGGCCYEVGPEVVEALDGAEHFDGRLLDLRALAAERLRGAGVAEVLHARVCTICDERFFSHRREGARAGRQAGIAWLS